MSKHKKRIPYTHLEGMLNNLLDEMRWQGINGIRGTDLRFLHDSPKDHNKTKCSGKHCRECAIMPTLWSYQKETDEHLNGDRILSLKVIKNRNGEPAKPVVFWHFYETPHNGNRHIMTCGGYHCVPCNSGNQRLRIRNYDDVPFGWLELWKIREKP